MSKHPKVIMETTDPEALCHALLENQQLNNKLHRRVQADESRIVGLETQIYELEKDLKWAKEYRVKCNAEHNKLTRAINSLPLPLRWLVERHITKLDSK